MNLNFVKVGHKGSPVIILHGLFGSSRNWMTISKKLAQHHTVYALDMRNHGESPHDPRMTYPEMTQDVIEFLDAQKLDSVNIIGHSMGGKTAMWLALNQPQRIQKMIVVDIAPVNYAHSFDDILYALQAVPLSEIKSRKDAESHMSRTITDLGLRQFLLQNLLLRDGYFCWRVNLDAIALALPDVVGYPDTAGMQPYPKPCLFIGGAQSDYITPRTQEAIEALFPAAHIDILPGAGHWPHVEQAQDFMALVTGFLDQ